MPSVIPPNNVPENSTEIVIIGSGLAGLAAGQLLREAGHNALILDKGRRAGGRMSTRRADGFLFNHGAQFVTARSAAFSAVCTNAVQAGQLAKWPLAGREDAFSGTPAMRGLAEFMAEGLTIRQQAEVKNITRVKPIPGPHNGPLVLQLADGTVIICRHLIVTCPAPQTSRLLREAAPKLSACADQVIYAPCWAVMAGFPAPIDLPRTLIQTPEEPISWATYEPFRPGASQTAALTLHATADFSKTHLEAEPTDICDQLLASFSEQQNIPFPHPSYSAAHRWRYAKVEQACPQDELFHIADTDSSIFVAGDWHPAQGDDGRFGKGARAEDAFLSGLRAAKQLNAKLA